MASLRRSARARRLEHSRFEIPGLPSSAASQIATKTTCFVRTLLTCYGLTVFFDMVIAVSVGVVLSAILFMRQNGGAHQPRARSILDVRSESGRSRLPKGSLYEINVPLFFAGRAQKAWKPSIRIQAGRITM